MKTGRTNQSAKLREGPSVNEPFFDELEPDYPLVIHDSKNGWLEVTAKAKGLRTQDQRGWIAARLVSIDKPKPNPAPAPIWENVAAGVILSAAGVLGVGAVILVLIIKWG